MTNIILASTSNYRKMLLERLFLNFIQVAPQINEEDYKQKIQNPSDLATTLSEEKVKSIQHNYPQDLIIGGDQVCSCHGKIYDKPGNRENAILQLQELQGHSHQLITAITVGYQNKFDTILDITTLKMKTLSRQQIERYVDQDQPFDCAGSYKIESFGISLFESIESVDHTAITGVPLLELSTLLKKFGVITP